MARTTSVAETAWYKEALHAPTDATSADRNCGNHKQGHNSKNSLQNDLQINLLFRIVSNLVVFVVVVFISSWYISRAPFKAGSERVGDVAGRPAGQSCTKFELNGVECFDSNALNDVHSGINYGV